MNTQMQHSEAQLVSDGQQWRIDGDINYQTVVSLREQGEAQLEAASNNHFEIDFSSVGQVNTAALALLLCWHRKARALNLELKYVQIPAKLRAIAEMSDLDVLLGD